MQQIGHDMNALQSALSAPESIISNNQAIDSGARCDTCPKLTCCATRAASNRLSVIIMVDITARTKTASPA